MRGSTIWYDRADVNKAIAIWSVIFVLLAGWNLLVAVNQPVGSVPALSGMGLLLLLPYWIACLAYTLVLFAGLKDGTAWLPWPLFILLQLGLVLLDQGKDTMDWVAETWEYDRYLLVPFFYSVVVYLITLCLRKRLRLYNEAGYREQVQEEV